MGGTKRLEARIEAGNIFNTGVFANPQNNVTSGTFGVIAVANNNGAAFYPERQIRLGLVQLRPLICGLRERRFIARANRPASLPRLALDTYPLRRVKRSRARIRTRRGDPRAPRPSVRSAASSTPGNNGDGAHQAYARAEALPRRRVRLAVPGCGRAAAPARHAESAVRRQALAASPDYLPAR
jgi:hypothetical protein